MTSTNTTNHTQVPSVPIPWRTDRAGALRAPDSPYLEASPTASQAPIEPFVGSHPFIPDHSNLTSRFL